MLMMELATSLTFSGGIIEFSITSFTVGSLAINSIGKDVSSIILTSWNPAAFMVLMYSSFNNAPDRQPTYASMEFFKKSGSSFSKTISEIISLPPGFSTLNVSVNTLLFSGERLITQLEITMSTERSATGRFSISPSLNSTFVAFTFLTFCRAFSIPGLTPISR